MATQTGGLPPAGVAPPSGTVTGRPGPLARWLPRYDASPHNPVHDLLSRRRANTGTNDQRSALWLQQPVFLLFALWVLAAVAVLIIDTDLTLYETISGYIGILLVLSLADKLVLDFTAASAGLDSVRADIEGGRWDLIALSNLPVRFYVQAYHVETQRRTWRLMCRVTGFRLGLIVTGFLHFAILPILIPAGRINEIVTPYYTRQRIVSPLESLLDSILRDPVNLMAVLPVLLSVGVMAFVYVAEPRWRLRALAAGSVAVSSAHRQAPLDLMAAVAVVGRVWFAQILMGVFAFALLWVTGAILGPLFSSMRGVYITGWVYLLYLLPVWWMIRYGYQSLTRRWVTRSSLRLGKEVALNR